jgi:hypothetical protein
MPLKTGTHDIAGLLGNKQTSAAEYGLDNINEILQRDLAVHNGLVTEMVSEIAEVTEDRLRLAGTSDSGEMVQVDEYGRAPTQKPAVGANVGFPLRLWSYAIGWTRKWFQLHSPADMALATQAAQKAHRKAVLRDLKRAMFLSANYTFTDQLAAPKVELGVKRFTNADGQGVSEGPNGEVFDSSTHTHYLASASLTAGAVTSLVRTVQEHGIEGMLKLVISPTDRTAFEALTGFKPYPDPRINYVATDQNRQTIDIMRLDNLAIGTFGPAEVWVKPWAIANYAATYVANATSKPLAIRTRNGSIALEIAANLPAHPLFAEYMESEFGTGVWTRTAGGVLFFAGGAYVDPNIN